MKTLIEFLLAPFCIMLIVLLAAGFILGILAGGVVLGFIEGLKTLERWIYREKDRTL